jgi:CheY-like chemotaxis protein
VEKPLSECAIFVIEDSAAFRSLLLEYLNTLGYDVCAFASGEEAMQHMRSTAATEPELVISDIHMQRMTGFQLVRELRKASPGLPAILMTAFGNPEMEEQALEEGAAYLEKPFRLPVIRDLVQKLLPDSD